MPQQVVLNQPVAMSLFKIKLIEPISGEISLPTTAPEAATVTLNVSLPPGLVLGLAQANSNPRKYGWLAALPITSNDVELIAAVRIPFDCANAVEGSGRMLFPDLPEEEDAVISCKNCKWWTDLDCCYWGRRDVTSCRDYRPAPPGTFGRR